MGSLAALRLPRRLLLATTCSRWHARSILPCSIACSFPTSRWRRGSRRARPDAPSPQPGDRGFESCSLQRGVCCELRSSQARPASRANLTSLDYDLSYISILPPNPEIGRDHRLGNLKGAVLSAVQHAAGG